MDNEKWSQFLAVSPHTRLVKPIAWINRGVNFHGSLAEHFYITTDKGYDMSFLVLRCGDTGSQAVDYGHPYFMQKMHRHVPDLPNFLYCDGHAVLTNFKDLRDPENWGIAGWNRN